MAQTAAHLADRVIRPVHVRQWVISVPKRLRCFLADRPAAVTALTRIILGEIVRLLLDATGPERDGRAPPSARTAHWGTDPRPRWRAAAVRSVRLRPTKRTGANHWQGNPRDGDWFHQWGQVTLFSGSHPDYRNTSSPIRNTLPMMGVISPSGVFDQGTAAGIVTPRRLKTP